MIERHDAPADGGTSRTIVVTGGVGYIGSHLIRHLGDSQRVIRILDSMERAQYSALADLPRDGRFEFHEGDILDPSAVRRALEGADVVIHLAAQVRTPFSFDYPAFTEHVNHWGTAWLVEECISANVRRFVYASSGSVYGPGQNMDEESDCAPVGTYSQSKLGGEQAVRVGRDRGLDTTILRLATVFGDASGMRFDAVPNRFAYLAAVGRSIPLHGDGEQTRPVVHVSDVSRAFSLVLDSADVFEGTYNVVGVNTTVARMAEVIRQVVPRARITRTRHDVLSRLSLSLDGSAFRSLGWEPRVGLEEGLAEIIDRYGRFEPATDPGAEIFE